MNITCKHYKYIIQWFLEIQMKYLSYIYLNIKGLKKIYM